MIKYIKDWLISICIAIVIVCLLRTFIGLPTTVKGSSMLPTLVPEEKLFLSTFSKTIGEMPKRGDIVIFKAPSVDILKESDLDNPIAKYTDSENLLDKILYGTLGITKISYIKRIIGLPGDHIEIKDGNVFINDDELIENYKFKLMETDMSNGGKCSNITVPNGCVYVLGDNRTGSADSRRFGCIPINKIEGKAIFKWYPIKSIGKI